VRARTPPLPRRRWPLVVGIIVVGGRVWAAVAAAVLLITNDDQHEVPTPSGDRDPAVVCGSRWELLSGPNGSGKTTLLDAPLGRTSLASGTRRLGPGVVVGEISQGRDAFASASSVLDGFQRRTGVVTSPEARSLLAKFGPGAKHVTRDPASLSPGERTRATVATLQATGVNVLVLDEPTNHLDLPAIEQLEQAISGFEGTLIVVTHDRRFLEAMACTRTIEVDHGAVHEIR
jgi:ATPase subunit of ABC transporter with duplicated ATPase domains